MITALHIARKADDQDLAPSFTGDQEQASGSVIRAGEYSGAEWGEVLPAEFHGPVVQAHVPVPTNQTIQEGERE